ncbi:MAG: PaaI family thioesterase [Rhodobacteraceae bacterium]|nr:PaaI family thioesterase [Paracoccaceae bacterium]
MDISNKITQSFESQAFMNTIGAKLDLVEEGKVIISVELKPSMLQQHGFGHAGVTFSIGDSAAGYAALTKMGKHQEVLTSEMKIHLLSPADGETLKAVGSVLKAGRRLIVVQSDIYSLNDKNEKLVATMLGTMVPSIAAI